MSADNGYALAATTESSVRETLTVRRLTAFAEGDSVRQDWNDLVLRSGADIYQTFEWCEVWWRYYGAGRELHVWLYYRGEQLVGVIPAFTETVRLGLVRLRLAKLISADHTINLCNLPVLTDVFAQVIRHAVEELLGRESCDVLLFGPLAGPTARVDALLAAASETGLVAQADLLGDDCNTYFSLPESYEAYLGSLEKKPRNNLTRATAAITKTHRTAYDVLTSPAEVRRGFEEFSRMHENQWKSAGKLGHFGDWPRGLEFNRDLVETFAKQGAVRFFRIIADDLVVSSQFCFVCGRTTYFRLPARLTGAPWDRCSLGVLSLVHKLKVSIADGQRSAESGRGHYDYKLQYGGHEVPLRTVQLIRRGRGVRARVRAFRKLAALVEAGYYKLVFVRLAPRLPLLQRPLARFYIRSKW